MVEAAAKSGCISTASRSCPVCCATAARKLHHQDFVLPEGHPLQESYDVVVCTGCGFVYADTQVVQSDYDRFYARLSKYEDAHISTGGGESPCDEARLAELASLILERVPDKSARIVDIGCANGGLLVQLRRLGYENIAGVDPSSACVAHVRARGIEAYRGSLQQLPEQVRGSDCLVLSHVLEHVQDVAGTLDIIRRVLSPNGLLYAEVPDATRYTEFLSAPFQEFNTEHINHFSLASQKNLFTRAGFIYESGGSRTLEVGEGLSYPAVYGFFRRAETSARAQIDFDTTLEHNVKRYIAGSNALMDRIELHLEAQLPGLPGVVLWGMGQLAMKILRLRPLRDANIVACVDGNHVNHGLQFRGIRVIGIDRVPAQQYPIVVATLLHHREIVRQIRARGICNRIILLLPDLAVEDNALALQIEKP